MTLSVQNVSKRFGDRLAVDDVSFHIAPGETYGLLGPNGAGKTTVISVICGLLPSTNGTVTVADQPVTTSTVDVRRRIGYVPQNIAVYPDLSAAENLRFFGSLYGLSGQQLKNRIAEVLGVLGLKSRADDRVEHFSGGMQRRLNIGLALLHEPELLVLDEPTVGVDPQSRNAILDAIESLSADGLALLYTTHYMEEAQRLCDRVGIMDEGKLIAEGTRRDLVRQINTMDLIRLDFNDSPDFGAIADLDGVDRCAVTDHKAEISVDDASHRLADILRCAATSGGSVRTVTVIEPDLESVFLHLTGKALRDR